jgi:hypothetical protein
MAVNRVTDIFSLSETVPKLALNKPKKGALTDESLNPTFNDVCSKLRARRTATPGRASRSAMPLG